MANPVERLAATHVGRAIARVLYPFGSIRTVRRGPLKGFRVEICRGIGTTYVWGAQREWGWIAELRGGQCVYDIGANCGQSTMHIAHAVGPSGRVIAFEPVPDNFQRLERNIRLNELSQVTPVCAAAADREGVTSFTFEPDLPSQGKIAKDGGLTVQQMTLDGHFKRWGAPSYMKIDVEGGAGGVLDGAKDLIAAHRPTIYIETHNAVEMSAVDSFLATHRYRAHAIDGRAVSARLTTADSPLMLRPV